jgi:hypothetical protein
LRDLLRVLWTGDKVARFGFASKEGTDADVVGAVEDRLACLGDMMGADADDFARAQELSRFGCRQIILTEVDPIAA